MAPMYNPVDSLQGEIRLLMIDSIEDGEPIKCHLVHAALMDLPRFTALSYVWGDPSVTEDIILGGEAKAVTTNLAAALRYAGKHWRNTFSDRDPDEFSLWADAICINQDDTLERNIQVLLMRGIYMAAELVLSWLADDSRNTQLALETFPIVVKEAVYDSKNEFSSLEWMKKHPALCEDDKTLDDYGDPVFPRNERWNAMNRFFYLPYWHRIWIFQEMALAKKEVLICNSNKAVPFVVLLFACRAISNLKLQGRSRPPFISTSIWAFLNLNLDQWKIPDKVEQGRKRAEKMWERSTDPLDHAKAFSLTLFAASYHATDPKDHIYGLLGVSGIKLEPDYRATKTVGDVYRDYVEAWLKLYDSIPLEMRSPVELERLFFLSWGGVGLFDNTFSLPSWAPNFPEAVRGAYSLMYGSTCHADREVFPDQSQIASLNDQSLFLPGVVIEPISRVEQAPSLPSLNSRSFLDFVKDYASRHPIYKTGIPAFQSITRAVQCISGTTVDDDLTMEAFQLLKLLVIKGSDPPTIQRDLINLGLPQLDFQRDPSQFNEPFIQTFFPGYEGQQRNWRGMILPANPDDASPLEATFVQLFATAIYQRLFESSTGLLGLCPSKSVPGDLICVAKGSNVPIVLRKQDDHYAHVGCCFVLGLMHGEAKELVSSGQCSIEMLDVR